MGKIYPSLVAVPQDSIEKMVKLLEPVVPGFHIDIMDQEFVPTTGIPIEKAMLLAQITYRQLWIHLMVENPLEYVTQLQLPPDTIITFHIESHKHTFDLIKKITEKKWLPSIALKPNTGIDEVFPFLGSVYQVLLMSANPGLSGQPFLESVTAKIDPLVGYRNTSHLHYKIAMDGGITVKNISSLMQKGVDDYAVGSDIFNTRLGPIEAYTLLAERAE